jgi:predicted RNA-binding Zn ribbon-like protein
VITVIVGARFRQGAGRLCLDFVRTLRHRDTAEAGEELTDPAALSTWISQCGPQLTDPPPVPTPDQVGTARALREAVYDLLAAARGPDGPGSCRPAARRRINLAAGQPVPGPSLDGAGRLRWHAEDPVSAVLALVARDALDLATSAAAGRIRECAGPDCAALFLDSSRPGTRRWCSMDTCGNRAKKNTRRGRIAAGAAARG